MTMTGSLEHAHQQEFAPGVIGVDLGGQLGDPLPHAVSRDEHLFKVGSHVSRVQP
jgi:hypothetical protein